MRIVPASLMSVAIVGVLIVGAGCSMEAPQDGQAQNDDVSVDVVTDGVDTRQVVTVQTPGGAMTMDALTPEIVPVPERRRANVRAGATFSGATARAGVCLLSQAGWPDSYRTCSAPSECAAYWPQSVTGIAPDRWRCTWENGLGTGTKYCFYIPGPNRDWCAGSPALNGVPIGPGTYWTGWKSTPGGKYISQACYNNCAADDPSASSAANYIGVYY